MFIIHSVKEKRNLFSYELWTGGDYGTPTELNQNVSPGISYSVSSEYSANGNKSIKSIISSTAGSHYLRVKINDVSEILGETIKFTANVKTDYGLYLVIYAFNGSDFSSHKTSIPSNSTNYFNVTYTVPMDTVYLWIGIDFQPLAPQNPGNYYYTDDWSLEIS